MNHISIFSSESSYNDKLRIHKKWKKQSFENFADIFRLENPFIIIYSILMEKSTSRFSSKNGNRNWWYVVHIPKSLRPRYSKSFLCV